MIQKKYYKLIRVSHEDSEYFRITNISNEVGVFKMIKNGTPGYTPNLEYSTDGVNWTTYDFTTLPEISLNPKSNIYFRGTNTRFANNYAWDNVYSFYCSKSCAGYGNLCSLLNTDPTIFNTITTLQSWSFAGIFKNFTTLTKLPDLSNITSCGEYSLYSFANGCSSLVTLCDFSNLISVGNSSFKYSFNGCSSLEIGGNFTNLTTCGSEAFSQTYQACLNLSTVIAPNVSSWDTTALFNSWLNSAGTSATGTKTFYAPTGLTIPTNTPSGIPTGWTRVDY